MLHRHRCSTLFPYTTLFRSMGVSLIQSNAAGFGANIAEPSSGIFLQNRGLGFSLAPGHPAEYGPARRPPSTLSPALRSEEHTSELQSRFDLVCRLLLEKKKL